MCPVGTYKIVGKSTLYTQDFVFIPVITCRDKVSPLNYFIVIIIIMADQIITVECEQQSAERNINENGEDIIMEAKFSHCWFYCLPIFIWICVSCVIVFIPLTILMIVLSYFQVRNWRLYLTQNAIYYHDTSPSCCRVYTYVIPLSYIEYINGYEGCDPTTIYIQMKRSNWMKMMGTSPNACENETTYWYCCNYDSDTVTLWLYYVKNPEGFIEAVQTCMATA